MVDIISNRVQEAYGSFRLPGMFGSATTQTVEGGIFSTYAMLKRFGEQKKRKRQMDKENDRKVSIIVCVDSSTARVGKIDHPADKRCRTRSIGGVN